MLTNNVGVEKKASATPVNSSQSYAFAFALATSCVLFYSSTFNFNDPSLTFKYQRCKKLRAVVSEYVLCLEMA